jgi:hypothetical protein
VSAAYIRLPLRMYLMAPSAMPEPVINLYKKGRKNQKIL